MESTSNGVLAGSAPRAPTAQPTTCLGEIDRIGSRLHNLWADRERELESIQHQINRAEALSDRLGLPHYPRDPEPARDAAKPSSGDEPATGTIAHLDYGHNLHWDLHTKIEIALAELAYQIGRLEAL